MHEKRNDVGSSATVPLEGTELPSKLEWLHALIERSRDLMAVTDPEGKILFINRAGRSLLGLDGEMELGNLWLSDFFEADGRSLFGQIIKPTLSQNGSWESDSYLLQPRQGEAIPAAINVALLACGDSRSGCDIIWTIRDHRIRRELSRQIEQRVREHRVVAELARQAQSIRWLDLLRNAVGAVANTLDVELVVVAQPIEGSDKLHLVARHDLVALNFNVINGGAKSQSGYAMISGQPVITPDIDLETRFDTSGGRRCGMASGMAVPILENGQPHGALSLHSLTRRKFTEDDVIFLEAVASVLSSAQKRIAVERELRHLSLHDPLTGLANRALALDRIQHGLTTLKTKNDNDLMAVLLLDLDNFKSVNDSLGHDNGDRVLVDLVPRLHSAVHDGDTVSRLGGDEFLITCDHVRSPFEAIDLANRLRQSWNEPFLVDERSVFLSGSIGITIARAGSQATELVREADTAMYRAKNAGLGGMEMYEPTMGEASWDRFRVATDLHTAIEQNQLWLAYQPIFELSTGKIASIEALCRWDHPVEGPIAPHVFIKLAEETGQIGYLGFWVLETACREAMIWQRINPEIRLRVNVSALQIKEEAFVGDVKGILQRTGFPARMLGLEVTEGVILNSGDISGSTIMQLRELGVELLIDDYGTGYSSLSYLVRFSEMSALKIDSEFIRLAVEKRCEAIICSIVNLGHTLGMEVVAEGVETQEQLKCVRNSGCDYAQGNLLGSPVKAQEIRQQLQI